MKVYKLRNLINNKLYVGKTEKTLEIRLDRHLKKSKYKENRPLYNAFRKYGFENFVITLIEECSSKEQLKQRESFWIKELNSLVPNGYNLTEGGEGGYLIEHWPEEDKRKLWDQQALKRTGMKRTEEFCKERSILSLQVESNYTEEFKIKRSEDKRKWALENNITPPKEYWCVKGCEGFFKGKNHTDETKKVLSKVRMGKTYEEILGEKRALELKQEKSIKWKGTDNPSYREEMTKEQKINFWKLISKNTRIVDIGNILGFSEFLLRKYFRKEGIDNIQIFKSKFSQEEWEIFCERKILDVS